jgi:hypothetical protein
VSLTFRRRPGLGRSLGAGAPHEARCMRSCEKARVLQACVAIPNDSPSWAGRRLAPGPTGQQIRRSARDSDQSYLDAGAIREPLQLARLKIRALRSPVALRTDAGRRPQCRRTEDDAWVSAHWHWQ